mmetsp:Transcript_19912/g.45220  ORF Transcript_19912/g.45220 Transcript_19912/m.45220 type:complete len:98 (+) Transcript_19912:226-519(+)
MPPFIGKIELTEDHERLHPVLSRSNLLTFVEDSNPIPPAVPSTVIYADNVSYWSWPSTAPREEEISTKNNLKLSKKVEDVLQKCSHLSEADQYWYGM